MDKGLDLIVVKAFYQNRVDLQRREPGCHGYVDACQSVLKPSAPGDAGVLFRIKGVQTDVDPPEPRGLEIRSHFRQQNAVGGHGKIPDAGDGPELFHQIQHPGTHQGLSPGQADLVNAHVRPGTHQCLDLLKGKVGGMPALGHALLGHAVHTAQVTQVGDGDPQIIDFSSKVVSQISTTFPGASNP